MQIRPAQPADALAIAEVHIRAWQIAYRDLLPAPYLAQLSPAAQAARYTFSSEDPRKPQTILAVEDATILGFASTMPSRDPDRRQPTANSAPSTSTPPTGAAASAPPSSPQPAPTW